MKSVIKHIARENFLKSGYIFFPSEVKESLANYFSITKPFRIIRCHRKCLKEKQNTTGGSFIYNLSSTLFDSQKLKPTMLLSMDDTLSAQGASQHVPVLLEATMEYLKPEAGGLFLDGTFGGGGHTRAMLDSSPEVCVVAIDQDPEAEERAWP